MAHWSEALPADPVESPTTNGLSSSQAAGSAEALAEVLAGVVKVDEVSVDSHFFDDLGADSLVMAQFCARVRKRPTCRRCR